MKHKRLTVLLAAAVIAVAAAGSGCGRPAGDTSGNAASGGADDNIQTDIEPGRTSDENAESNGNSVKEEKILDETAGKNRIAVRVNPDVTYQTLESFGTSGCWWAQYVGGWDNEYKDTGREVREELAMLLYDKEYGIGLTCYRYNVGAGSLESGKGVYWDPYRRAASFETAPFTYDWNRDRNAVWFLRKAVELGAGEVVFFCNSPLERLTINGTAQMTKGEKTNLAPENYDDFAKYVLDVTEHFVEEGIPVRFVSPINEPQWDWIEGQEGCHYEPGKTAGVYRAFLKDLESRPALAGVELSGPESGEWKGEAIAYTSAILNDSVAGSHFTTIDNHSYWTDTASKKAFRRWMDARYPDVKLRMSEWCEMVNGSDTTMDSAINLARVLSEDLTVLDVVSWQNWVAAAQGGYRDGLVYVSREKKTLNPLKRLWGYGNYSRYIRPGYVRVETETGKEGEELSPVAFTGVNEDGQHELVLVFINGDKENKPLTLAISGNFRYTDMSIYETSGTYNLECVKTEQIPEEMRNSDSGIDIQAELAGESITTLVFSCK